MIKISDFASRDKQVSRVFGPVRQSPFLQPETTEFASPKRRQLMGVKISGTGSFLPPTVITNSDLARAGCDEEWIEQRTGIRERRSADPDHKTSDLATAAAVECLSSSGISREDVSLILVATTTPDFGAPSTAALVQGKMGCEYAAAMDVNAGCSGFVHALITGSHFVASGLHPNVLVIGADIMTRKCDPNNPKIRPLFGDGAGAVLLSASTRSDSFGDSLVRDGIINYAMGSDGTQAHLIKMAENGVDPNSSFIEMDGRAVFKWATQHIPDLIEDTLRTAGVAPGEIDLFVLHQANQRINDAARKRTGISENRFFANIERLGNTSSASVAIAIDEARRSGKISRHSKVLICGFGAGLNWSSCIFQGFDAGRNQ